MTTAEFDVQFDVLYNNITSNQAPGLNAYEKSVFLTKAQFQLIQEYFNRRIDNSGGGFDGSEKRQIDFSSIIDWEIVSRLTANIPTYDPRSIVYVLPKDLMFIIDEQLSLIDYSVASKEQADSDTFYSVVPISYDDYARLMAKPYKYPPKGQAWRLMTKKRTVAIEQEQTPYYETQHSSEAAYANVEGVESSIFTIEFDSNSDNNDEVKVVIVGSDYDDTTLVEEGYIILKLTSEQMDQTIESVLDEWVKEQEINNLKVSIISGYESKTWAELWGTDDMIVEVENEGSELKEDDTTEEEVAEPTRGEEPIPIPVVNELRQLVEIIGKFPSTPYYRVRYVRKPCPIILENLAGLGVTIEGSSAVTQCELPEEMHHEILERAVTLAKIAWQGTTMTQTALAVQAMNKQN